MREINYIHVADKINMGGIMIDQALPNQQSDKLDPVLLIHHWKNKFPGGQKQSMVGVGPHPHRGFSPVTVILKGSLHHRDSLGNNSIVSAGGVQWMNAGKGVTHSERPTKELAERGGDFEIIQFWINTPAKDKMKAAEYHAIHAERIPTVQPANNVQLSVIAGRYDSINITETGRTDINVYLINMEKDSSVTLNTDTDSNVLLYQIEGLSDINNSKVAMDKSLVVFKNKGNEVEIKANQQSLLLYIEARPLNEKVTQYGPFVMNTTTEIMEAIRDAQIGKMGVLIEEFK